MLAGFPNPCAGKFVFGMGDEFRAAESGKNIESVFPGFADDVVGDAPVVFAAFAFGPPPVEDSVVMQADRSESALTGSGEKLIQVHSASTE